MECEWNLNNHWIKCFYTKISIQYETKQCCFYFIILSIIIFYSLYLNCICYTFSKFKNIFKTLFYNIKSWIVICVAYLFICRFRKSANLFAKQFNFAPTAIKDPSHGHMYLVIWVMTSGVKTNVVLFVWCYRSDLTWHCTERFNIALIMI